MRRSFTGLGGVLSALKEAVGEFVDDDMATYASALAFQTLLALFPFLIFLIALLGFLQLPEFFDYLRAQTTVLLRRREVPHEKEQPEPKMAARRAGQTVRR